MFKSSLCKARNRLTICPLLTTTCDILLDDEAVSIAVRHRLRASIGAPHDCPCGSLVTVDGSLGLSCGPGPGRVSRHNVFNNLICRSLMRPGCLSQIAATRMGGGGNSPDGLILIPLCTGRSGCHSNRHCDSLLTCGQLLHQLQAATGSRKKF